MTKLQSILIAAFAALALAAVPSASAAPSAPTVTVSSPTANAFLSSTPSLAFNTTGTQLLTECTLVGPGVSEFDENCNSPYKPISSLSDGTYTYSITATNEEGSAGKSVTFTIDKTAPSLMFLGSVTEGTIGNVTSVPFRVGVSDTNLKTVTCAHNGTPVACSVAGNEINMILSGLTEGTHAFSVTANDKAGNSVTIVRNWKLDHTKPTAMITYPGGGGQFTDNTPEFQVSGADANAFSKHCWIDDTAPVACAGGTWTVPTALSDGEHTAWLEVRDVAMNSTYVSYMFELDASFPTVSIAGPGATTTDTAPAFSFTVTDAHDVTTRCAFDPADVSLIDQSCAAGESHVPQTLALGAHSFQVLASDSFGNTILKIYDFTVVAPDQPQGGDGSTNGPGGGTAGGAPSLTLKAKSSKVKAGKFTVTVTVTAKGATCPASVKVKLAPAVKKAKAATAKVKLGANCTGTAKVKLAARYKGKKAKLTTTGASLKIAKL